MPALRVQLNTPVEITRDLSVQVVDLVTNRTVETTPFLDGTVNLRNLNPGRYRLRVTHPNLPFTVLDQPVQVLTGRPTFVPVKIDLDIFENTPVRDVAEADLEPVRQQLRIAGDTAERQAAKRGGEPIFADDWNELAGAVDAIGTATVDLTRRISPQGHDHAELIEKLDEIQRNLERFLAVFGQSMAQVQRQLEQLALEQRARRVLDKIPNLPPPRRLEVEGLVDRLGQVRGENPYLYLRELRRAGEQMQGVLADVIPDTLPELHDDPDVVDLRNTAEVMAATMPTRSYEAEIQQHLRVDDRSATGNLLGVIRDIRREV
jgi:hypothetical protein